ncbi:hypothetical protein [Kaistella sp.]|uniref:hypothetical protein n=1 Tax=Kaistella sp. TaxID=2782235 RepID=UPI003C67C3F9
MKKSIAILSVFLLLTVCSCHHERDGRNLSKIEIRLASLQKQSDPFLGSVVFSYLDGENEPDPPRQDPWQWLHFLEELLEYLSTGKGV